MANKEREEWLQYVDQFYELVEEFMRECIDQGKVRRQRKNMGFGTPDTMVLDIGDNSIVFEPTAMTGFGVRGQVNMRCDKRTVEFVLVMKDTTKISLKSHISVGPEPMPEPVEPVDSSTLDNWIWKVATKPLFTPLCKDSFQDAVKTVSKG